MLRTHAILKHLKSAHFSTKNGYFSVFWRVNWTKILLQASLHRILCLFDPGIIIFILGEERFLEGETLEKTLEKENCNQENTIDVRIRK